MNLSYHDIIFLLIPGILAYINNPDWDAKIKWIIAMAVCFIGAFIEIWLSGQCGGLVACLQNFPAIFGKVLILVMGSYAAFWKAPIAGTPLADFIEHNFGTGSKS